MTRHDLGNRVTLDRARAYTTTSAPIARPNALVRGLGLAIVLVFLMSAAQNALAHVAHGYSEFFSLAPITPVDNDPNSPPAVTRLAAIYPNPFNPRTTIAFDLAQPGIVEVAIFDVRGERIRVLESAEEPVGRYEATWDGLDDHGRDVATGTYICRLMTAHGSETKKMVLAR